MRKLALILTLTLIACAGCTTSPRSEASAPASAAVTDLGTITVKDHDWYQCTLSGARICRVCITAVPNGQALVQVVVLSQDAQRILARPQIVTNLGKKVILGIGEGRVSLTPEIKPQAKL
jgi:hypothetical protein